MASNVFSFSTKTQEDRDFIAGLKKECRKQGKSFSFMVVEALKASQANKVKGAV